MLTRAVVLAAGKSSRIAAVTHGLPKPLLEVDGVPIISRNLRWLARQGIRQAWINLHYRPQEIRKVVGDGNGLGLHVEYALEEQILGTAGGVRNICRHWDETVLVLYGDNLVSADLHAMEEIHRSSGAAATLALFDRKYNPHTGMAGGVVDTDAHGWIKGFFEGEGANRGSLVNVGLYLLEPSVVQHIPPGRFCDFGRDLFPQLLLEGVQVYGHVISGYCLGLDTPESYQRAVEMISKGTVRLE
ncbi:MAG: NDP-sugar synthase [Candidatus Binataceae bacterium]